MTAHARIACLVASLAAPALASCFQDTLDDPSLVKTPRILAIVAEPPEAAPGQDVLLRPLVGLPDDTTIDPGALEARWLVCARSESLIGFGGAQYDQLPNEKGCDESDPRTLVLPNGPEGLDGMLPGLVTTAAFTALENAAMTYGDLLPPATLERIVDTAGLPLAVQLDLRLDGVTLVRGFKRVIVSRRDEPGTNPPPPRFSLGCEGDKSRVWLSARGGGDPFACVPEDGVTPTVAAGSRVCLGPDPDDSSWLETFPVIDVTGVESPGEEDAYYSWFSTGGKLDDDTTQRPLRDTHWRAPGDAGLRPIWLVVRDGHGGTSACRADLDVTR